jgi:nitrate reductase NapE component
MNQQLLIVLFGLPALVTAYGFLVYWMYRGSRGPAGR